MILEEDALRSFDPDDEFDEYVQLEEERRRLKEYYKWHFLPEYVLSPEIRLYRNQYKDFLRLKEYYDGKWDDPIGNINGWEFDPDEGAIYFVSEEEAIKAYEEALKTKDDDEEE